MEVDVDDEEGDMEDALEDLGLDMGGDMESDNDEELEIGDEEMLMTDLPGDDLEVDDEEEVLLPLDLTAASDDEILKVFKAMGEDDGIIVKQDGDDVHLADAETDAEYVIQLGESEEEAHEGEHTEEDHHEGEYKEEKDHVEEEVVYEIEIGEEEAHEEEKLMKKWVKSTVVRRVTILNLIKIIWVKKKTHEGETEEGETDEGETTETARSNASLRKVS